MCTKLVCLTDKPTRGCLALALFELWVLFVDDINLALAAHDFAINGTFFDGRTDLHRWLILTVLWLLVAVSDSAPAQIVWRHFYRHTVTRQDSDVVHAHFSGNGCGYDVPVLKLYLKNGVRQRFQHFSVLFNQIIFGHIGASSILGCKFLTFWRNFQQFRIIFYSVQNQAVIG